jgi:hypothetical protein
MLAAHAAAELTSREAAPIANTGQKTGDEPSDGPADAGRFDRS